MTFRLVATSDYYSFGMPMPERSLSLGNYRFGFNGKENDNEVKGLGNWQDYGMRVYDPRLARFQSVDPLTKDFPWYSPYQFSGNKPIWKIDLDGLEEADPKLPGGEPAKDATPTESGTTAKDNASRVAIPAAVITQTQKTDQMPRNSGPAPSLGEKIWDVVDNGGGADGDPGYSPPNNTAPLPVKIIAKINPLVSAGSLIITGVTAITGEAQNIEGEKPTWYSVAAEVLDVATVGVSSMGRGAVQAVAEAADLPVMILQATVTTVETIHHNQEIQGKEKPLRPANSSKCQNAGRCE